MVHLNIRRVRPEEEPPFDLLYLADESPEAVADYIVRGECYVAETVVTADLKPDGEGGEDPAAEIVGEFVLLPTRPFTVELVSVAVRGDRQRQGIATTMIDAAVGLARQHGFRIMEVGTGNCGTGQIELYQKCGFRIIGIDRDFFTRLYPEPISENGMACRDMVRFQMYL